MQRLEVLAQLQMLAAVKQLLVAMQRSRFLGVARPFATTISLWSDVYTQIGVVEGMYCSSDWE